MRPLFSYDSLAHLFVARTNRKNAVKVMDSKEHNAKTAVGLRLGGRLAKRFTQCWQSLQLAARLARTLIRASFGSAL